MPQSEEAQLAHLSDLSERAPDLRVLAAKMEPLGEDLQKGSSFKYALASASTDEQRAEIQAKATRWTDTAARTLKAVDELRDMADRVEGIISDARKLVRE